MVWLCVFRLMLDWFWFNQRHFRSIESNFQSIKSCIESFFKTFVSHMFRHFKTFSKILFSLHLISPRFLEIFLSFSSKFLQGFLSSYIGKTFLPFFFILFSLFMHLRDIFGPWKFWGFWWFKFFLSQLINGF